MLRVRRSLLIHLSLASLLFFGTAVTGLASGFAVIEQSANGLGNAFSGGNAGSLGDASTIFFNPAAMTQLESPNLVAAGHVIAPTFEFDNDGSSYPLLGMPVTGADGGNGGETVFVPNLYVAHGLSEAMTMGIGINAPYGLMTEYDSDWVGRYHAIKSDLKSLNINPALAWRISDKLSMGLGVSAQYVEAELSTAIDFGGIVAAAGTPGTAPQMLDGRGKLEGDDWAYGFNAGLLCTPRDGSRIGLSYRSKIEHTIDGDATFSVPPPAMGLQAMGLFVDTSGKADLDTPDTAGIGLSQMVGEKLEVMIDATWTGWSSFEELRVQYGSMQPDSVTEEDWKDTWRYAIGVNYFCDDKWTLRAGTAYDESPVPDAQHRTPRIPDGDRLWVSLGAGYQAADDLRIDAGYTYLMFNDTKTDIVGTTGDRLTGDYEGSANIASVQVSLDF